MIVLKYPNGVIALQAYTVAELIAELQKYQQDLPVVFAWEGQKIGFGEDRIEVADYELAVGYVFQQVEHHKVLALYAEDY
jgi:hypothetical protein